MTDHPQHATQPNAAGKKVRPKKDRVAKLIFLGAALAIVAWLLVKQYYGPPPPFAYISDLPAALGKAKAENRRLVVIVYTRLPNDAYKRSVEGSIRQPGNREAFEKSNALCVRVTLGDPHLRTWLGEHGIAVDKTPAFLLLRPDGKPTMVRVGNLASYAHIGYMPEVDFRHGFLDAPPVPFSRNPQEAFDLAREEGRDVLALIDKDPAGEEGKAIWDDVLWNPKVVKALDEAAPVCLQILPTEADSQGLSAAQLPALLLVTPSRRVLARHEGAIDAETLLTEILSAATSTGPSR